MSSHNYGKHETEELYNRYTPVFREVLIGFSERLVQQISAIFPMPVTCKHRIKRFESFYRKLSSRGCYKDILLPMTNDLLGIRLVCPFLEDVIILEDYIEKSFRVVEVERKGAHFSFREFGYDSTHLQIEMPAEFNPPGISQPLYCEIQVRTILQDAWAEVEHELVYRSRFAPQDELLRRKMAAVNANLTLSDIIFQEIRDYQKELRNQFETQQNHTQQQIELLLQNDFDTLKTGPTVNNETLDSLLFAGLKAHNAGQYEKSIEIFSRLLENRLSNKQKRMVLMHRAAAYLNCSLIEQAQTDFTAAGTLRGSYDSFYYIGICLLIKRCYPEAFEAFSKSLSLDSDQPQTLLARARAAFKLARYDEALADCLRCLALSPNMSAALNLKEQLEKLKK
jgi:putative GTP pyrophosphokinase